MNLKSHMKAIINEKSEKYRIETYTKKGWSTTQTKAYIEALKIKESIEKEGQNNYKMENNFKIFRRLLRCRQLGGLVPVL